ncbi:hypothetical protein BT96DRAFT_618866, partial [Gymnopus androsaceus JB14]
HCHFPCHCVCNSWILGPATQSYHTSGFSGQAWVKELVTGHPDWIHTELGMHLHVFTAFVFGS